MPRKKKEIESAEGQELSLETEGAEGSTETSEPRGKMIIVNTLATHGFVFNGKYYTMWVRTFYKERTEIFNPSDPEKPCIYEANSYGPWKLGPLPYPTSLNRMTQILLEQCAYDKTLMLEKPTLLDFLEMLDSIRGEVNEVFQKAKYL